jgi:hypothetical protein
MVQAIANLTAKENYDLKLVLASMIPFDTFDLTNQSYAQIRLSQYFEAQPIGQGQRLILSQTLSSNGEFQSFHDL